MSRKPRIVVPEFPHHVTLRGNNGRRLFSYAKDYVRFIFLLSRALPRADCIINAVALMTNHVHLLLTPRDAGALSAFVKFVAQCYAQGRNAQRHLTGRLFDSRYHSTPVLTDEQLAITTAYIELNPVRAGIVERPGDYRWSTYRLHAARADSHWPRGLWTPSPWYESLSDHPLERAEHYERWVADVRARDLRPQEMTNEMRMELEQTLRATRRERRPNGTSAR